MSFDPAESLLRWHWEKRQAAGLFLPGIPFGEAPIDQCFASEDMAEEGSEIESNCLNPNSQRSEGSLSKFGTAASFVTDMDATAFAYWMALFQKKGRTPTVLTAAQSWRHILAPSETNVTFPKSLTGRVSRDDSLLQTFWGCQPNQIAISLGVREFVTVNIDFLFEHSTLYDFATVITETVPLAANKRPFLRGFPKFVNWQGTPTPTGAPEIEVTVLSAAGGTIETRLGTAGSFDTITVVDGGWVKIKDGSGNFIGQKGNEVELYINALGDADDLDEWHFSMIGLSAWTPSLPALLNLNEAHAEIKFEGTKITVTSISLNYAKGKIADEGIGGFYPEGILESGQRFITGAIDLRYIDDSHRARLLTGEPFTLEIILPSVTDIGSSTDPFSVTLWHPNCKLNGKPATVAGSTEYNQALAFNCYPLASDPLPDDMSATIDNGVVDLTI